MFLKCSVKLVRRILKFKKFTLIIGQKAIFSARSKSLDVRTWRKVSLFYYL